MALEKDEKESIIQKFQNNPTDTGSPEVQIALLTARINHLVEHLKAYKHDEHSRRGLLKMGRQRRRQLRYLAREHPERYETLVNQLGLRK